jgi:hypothetical protein
MMAKTNTKGRNNHTPYIKLHRGVTNSVAWESLDCVARCLLIAIWELHNGQNNGQIGYGHRQARKELRVGSNKVQKAFGALEDRGFIVARTFSSFNWKSGAGAGKTTEWELTVEPCDGKPPKNSFRTWAAKQKTATTVGAVGTHVRNRSRELSIEKGCNGSHSSNRSDQIHEPNGSYSSDTYNIPPLKEIADDAFDVQQKHRERENDDCVTLLEGKAVRSSEHIVIPQRSKTMTQRPKEGTN